LTLFASGRDRQIDNEDIVLVQTTWPPAYQDALELIHQGNLPAATQKLQSALAAERREWAQQIIAADLVRVYQATENHSAATKQFLAIVRADPQTRFFHLCPLPWTAGTNPPNQLAQTLINSQDPVEQLIGASWLLAGPRREKATEVLDQLSRDIEVKVKSLATAQLWRLRVFNANEKLIEVWKNLIHQMPAQNQAGPWFLLAEAQNRVGQTEDATISWMRIPILHPEQLGLSAAALYRASQLLHNNGQTSEARTLSDELQQKFQGTVWAQQASSQFETADPAPNRE
jgi:tetratricopeptide (TPR) repeat protein